MLNIGESSYGNAESANHKRISRDRVGQLARYYRLGEVETAELVAGWEALPQSEYNKRQATSYEVRKAYRSKAKNHDRLKLSLLEVCTQLVTNAADPATLCSCVEVDMFDESLQPSTCELCTALQLLGLGGFTGLDDTVARLAAAQERLTGGTP